MGLLASYDCLWDTSFAFRCFCETFQRKRVKWNRGHHQKPETWFKSNWSIDGVRQLTPCRFFSLWEATLHGLAAGPVLGHRLYLGEWGKNCRVQTKTLQLWGKKQSLNPCPPCCLHQGSFCRHMAFHEVPTEHKAESFLLISPTWFHVAVHVLCFFMISVGPSIVWAVSHVKRKHGMFCCFQGLIFCRKARAGIAISKLVYLFLEGSHHDRFQPSNSTLFFHKSLGKNMAHSFGVLGFRVVSKQDKWPIHEFVVEPVVQLVCT